MFKTDIEIPHYNTSIKLDENGNLNFFDLESGKSYSISTILERDILCNGISYGEFSYKQFSSSSVYITSTRGILYRIILCSYDYSIEDVASVKLDTVGETVCEYFKIPIVEETGRDMINLDIENETASYHEFNVKDLTFTNTRKKEEWKGSNFENCIIKMLQEIHKSISYNDYMNEMHGLYPIKRRNLRTGEDV